MQLIIPVLPLTLNHDGVYDFMVLANGQEIDRQKFTARQVRENDHGTDESEAWKD